jgi:hypothetical protein
MSNGRKPSGNDALGLLGLSGSSLAPGTAERPSIETARRRLGGRAGCASKRAPGSLVQATLRGDVWMRGVLLWATDRHCDVWFEDGVARRARRHAVMRYAGPMPEGLLCVAAEMRLFASLVEGAQVRWERPSGIAEGCIVEKCLYGAIVATRDGMVVAVGFRKLWPANARGVC